MLLAGAVTARDLLELLLRGAPLLLALLLRVLEQLLRGAPELAGAREGGRPISMATSGSPYLSPTAASAQSMQWTRPLPGAEGVGWG